MANCKIDIIIIIIIDKIINCIRFFLYAAELPSTNKFFNVIKHIGGKVKKKKQQTKIF